jgi:diaminopimelate epimerase
MLSDTLFFTKMHGLGNDFVLLDALEGAGPRSTRGREITPELARSLCDRRFGIGADQILWLKPAKGVGTASVRMDILNSDGSMAEMCGNGIRAVALYLSKYHPSLGVAGKPLEIATAAGIKSVLIKGDQVTVDMGAPLLGKGFETDGEALSPEPSGVVTLQSRKFFEVSTGNPHAIFFVTDVSKVELERVGREVESHPRFPKRTNVEFVQVKSGSEIRVRVWERGAGATLACGTGACASAVAALATGRVRSPVTVELPGGNLVIAWEKGGSISMTGPAVEVFSGEFLIA